MYFDFRIIFAICVTRNSRKARMFWRYVNLGFSLIINVLWSMFLYGISCSVLFWLTFLDCCLNGTRPRHTMREIAATHRDDKSPRLHCCSDRAACAYFVTGTKFCRSDHDFHVSHEAICCSNLSRLRVLATCRIVSRPLQSIIAWRKVKRYADVAIRCDCLQVSEVRAIIGETNANTQAPPAQAPPAGETRNSQSERGNATESTACVIL